VEYRNGGARDKISLCARTGAHGGPRGPNAGPGQRISSSRSHISRIPLSYFILLAPSPAPGTAVPPGTAAGPFEGPESTSFFVISLFGSPDSIRVSGGIFARLLLPG